jgi:hypothetical protein
LNFFQIIRSVEELLYEAVTWLLFYPVTLWRCLTQPLEVMRYTTEELQEEPDTRFTESISPPLFLMLSVLVAHAVEMALGIKVEAGEADGAMVELIIGSEQNLLLFRSFVFALFPLVMATGVLRRKALKLDRETLKGPFYRQCYFAGPYCLMVSIGTVMLRHPSGYGPTLGMILMAVATLWYLHVETRWLRVELGLGWGQAAGLALWLFTIAAVSTMVVAVTVLSV